MTITWNPGEMRREQTRRAGSKALILDALKAHPEGITNHFCNDRLGIYRYGARLLELRREGHAIESIHEGDGTWRFVLRSGPKPGEAGYLASLPAVSSITGRAIPAPATTDNDPAATGLLFDL